MSTQCWGVGTQCWGWAHGLFWVVGTQSRRDEKEERAEISGSLGISGHQALGSVTHTPSLFNSQQSCQARIFIPR